jgi:hypothetical protein
VLKIGLSVFVVLLFLSYPSQARAEAMPAYKNTAEMVQHEFLDSHHSTFTGQMVIDAWRFYGIPVLPLLVIMGAETSLGDPVLGGKLAAVAYNYGCLKFGDRTTKWGELSLPEPYMVRDVEWYQFPDPRTGMLALGRYLKVGPKQDPGYYKRILTADPIDWRAFAGVYYGSKVSGIDGYVRNLQMLEAQFRKKAAAHGFGW